MTGPSPSRRALSFKRVLVASTCVVLLAVSVFLGDRWHSYLVEECPTCGSTRSEDWYVFGLVHEATVIESGAYRAFFKGEHVHDWRHQHSHEFGGPKASSSIKDNWFGLHLRRAGVVEFLQMKIAEGSLAKEEVRRLCALPQRPAEADLANSEVASAIKRAEALVVEAGVKPDYWWPRPK